MNRCKNLNFNLVEHKGQLWYGFDCLCFGEVWKGYLNFWWNLGPAPTSRAWQILVSLNTTAAKPIKGHWRKSGGPGILEEVAIDVPGFLSSGNFWVVFLSSGQCSLGFSWLRRTGCTDEGDGIKSSFPQLPKYKSNIKILVWRNAPFFDH